MATPYQMVGLVRMGLSSTKPKSKRQNLMDLGQFKKDAQRKIMQDGVVFVSVAITAPLFVTNKVSMLFKGIF